MRIIYSGADLGGGCRGCTPPPLRWPAVFKYNWYSAKKNYVVYWFWSRARDECTPPKKNPGSAPVIVEFNGGLIFAFSMFHLIKLWVTVIVYSCHHFVYVLLIQRLFLTLRGITGFFQGGVYITLYVLVIEFVGPKHRSFVGTLMWIFYTSSLMLLSGLAYGIREWRTLSIVISVPAFPLLIFWRFVYSQRGVDWIPR